MYTCFGARAACVLILHFDSSVVCILLLTVQEPETEAAVGSAIRGRVLDVSKAEGILDLSLRPELIPAKETKGKKKAAAVDALQVCPTTLCHHIQHILIEVLDCTCFAVTLGCLALHILL